MRFTIDDGSSDTPVRLKLVGNRRGTQVDLVGYLPDGMEFYILSFNEDGTFFRHSGIPADSGFKLTDTDQYGNGHQIAEAGQEPAVHVDMGCFTTQAIDYPHPDDPGTLAP